MHSLTDCDLDGVDQYAFELILTSDWNWSSVLWIM